VTLLWRYKSVTPVGPPWSLSRRSVRRLRARRPTVMQDGSCRALPLPAQAVHLVLVGPDDPPVLPLHPYLPARRDPAARDPVLQGGPWHVELLGQVRQPPLVALQRHGRRWPARARAQSQPLDEVLHRPPLEARGVLGRM